MAQINETVAKNKDVHSIQDLQLQVAGRKALALVATISDDSC